MTPSSSDAVGKALKARFAQNGFRPKGRYGVLMKQLNADARAILALGRHKLRDGPVIVYPVAGVRFESIYVLGREFGCYPPGGQVKLLHPWPGQTPPPMRRGTG